MTDLQSVDQLRCEGGRWEATACNNTKYIVAGVKCNKDLFSRGVPKTGNHVNVILFRKNILKTVEMAINGSFNFLIFELKLIFYYCQYWVGGPDETTEWAAYGPQTGGCRPLVLRIDLSEPLTV
jgi:hypothetical protein